MSSKKSVLVTALALSLFTLGGCDQVRSRMAELISPEPPAQALQAVDRLIDEGKYQEAKEKAVLRTQIADAPLRGEFAFAASRASAFKGDTDEALRYLALAFENLQLNTDLVMSEPAFRALQTNLRFLQVITHASSKPQAAKRQDGESAPVLEVGAGNAQIREDSKGTEVRAGDVVIRLPN